MNVMSCCQIFVLSLRHIVQYAAHVQSQNVLCSCDSPSRVFCKAYTFIYHRAKEES